MSVGQDRVLTGSATLVDIASRILQRLGVPAEGATRTAHSLVTADERGVETHGLMRLRSYVERIEAGGITADPEIVSVRDTPTTALVDGGNGLGAVVGTHAMNVAMDKAAAQGVGLVVARNLNHYGAAAYYTLMPVERDMIGLSATNVLALIAPTGSSVPLVGNNPLSLAFPATGSPPVVWDSAMSTSTWGRALVAAQRGEQLPPDAFLDGNGNPTTDPAAVLAGGSILPIAGYKGYGLALCVALLTGVLGGGMYDADIALRSSADPGNNTAVMGAIRVDSFADPAEYAGRIGQLASTLHAAPRQPGVERIWLPGEKEAELARERHANGVPVQDAVRVDVVALAERLGVEIDDRFRAGEKTEG
jgi:LDH2 family malate/lactate/ureidoglycolate dehydrogenase